MNIRQDLIELKWAVSVFQRCVPEQYRTPMDLLIAKYYSNHPSNEVIDKVVTMLENFEPKKFKEREDLLKYVKQEL